MNMTQRVQNAIEFVTKQNGEVAELHDAVAVLLPAIADDDVLMRVAMVAPAYAVGRDYVPGEVIAYGLNGVGDPQLYRVVQGHTSQADWLPPGVPALYKAIGLTHEGVPIWAQPLGAHDAYAKGDRVMYNDRLYESLMDGNVWSPSAYPAGWKAVAA